MFQRFRIIMINMASRENEKVLCVGNENVQETHFNLICISLQY